MKTTILYFGCITLLFFSACKKTNTNSSTSSNGSKIMEAPEKRLKGAWNLSDYTFNGVSIADTINKKLCKPLGFDLKNNFILRYEQYVGDPPKKFEFGAYVSYDAFDDTSFIKLKFFKNNTGSDPMGGYYNPFNELFVTPYGYDTTAVAYWAVSKLYKDDLHLTLNTDSGAYKLIFVRRPG